VLRELGVGFVAYSPIGRGFLSGKIPSLDALDATDSRRNGPRFQGENFAANMKLVDEVNAIAAAHGATPAQVAIAWVLRQGSDIVPIPGTKHLHYLEENARAASVNLPESAWLELDRVLADFKTAGLRYNEGAMKMLDAAE
jgi:aryl-alcohol dehydrogenase-like predicted oxidoreductase